MPAIFIVPSLMTYIWPMECKVAKNAMSSKSFLEVWQISSWALDLLLFANMSHIAVISSVWILDGKTIWKRHEANHSLESSPVEPGQDEQIQVEQSPKHPASPLQPFIILDHWELELIVIARYCVYPHFTDEETNN